MRVSLLIITVTSLIAGCRSYDESQREIVLKKINTITLIDDYYGDYYGVLPCAACPGIRTYLTIREDKTFSLKMEYIGDKSNQVNITGYYIFSDNMLTLKNTQGLDRHLMVEEEKVHFLDNNKRRVEGNTSIYYTLIKK